MKNKNWAKERADGKVIVPEEYEDMPQEWLESFGYIRKEDIKITDYDEELAQCLSELIEVPFEDLKPYLADNINKIFIDGNEFKAVVEEAKNNYAQALNENNKLVRLFTESFAPLKWPTSYDEKLKFIFEAMRDKEAMSRQFRWTDEKLDKLFDNRSCGYSVSNSDIDEANDEYEYYHNKLQEANQYHKELRQKMAEMACPEIVAKKGDGEVSL